MSFNNRGDQQGQSDFISNDSTLNYSILAQLLHWVIALLIVLQYLLVNAFEHAEEHGQKVLQIELLANHKSIGITVLALAILRLIVKFFSASPPLPQDMPSWQKKASQFTQTALYVLLFLFPLSGWLMSSASAYSVSWFGIFQLPDLIGADESLKQFFYVVHEFCHRFLVLLALLHIGAALKHHFIDKDHVLKSMFSVLAIGVSVLAFIFLTYQYYWSTQKVRSDKSASLKQSQIYDQLRNNHDIDWDMIEAGLESKEIGDWLVDKNKSSINFKAEQAGAMFDGTFNQWQARIHFDETKLKDSVVLVSIDLGSVVTNDEERDETIKDKDFFNINAFPVARFFTNNIKKYSGNNEWNFIAEALIEIKGITTRLNFYFNYTEEEGIKKIKGYTRMNRLIMQIGTGDWLDTEWVGQYVDVYVEVEAQ